MSKKVSHSNLTDIGLSKSIKFNIPKQKQKQEQEIKAKQREEDRLQRVDEKNTLMSVLKNEIFQIIEAEYKRQVGKEEGLQQQQVKQRVENQALVQQFDDKKLKKHPQQNRRKYNKFLSHNKQIGGQQKDLSNKLNKPKIHSLKLIQNESLRSLSLQKSRYNLNEQKYLKINDNKEEIFKARPKLGSTPTLDTYQLGKKSKTFELQAQRPKQKKVKFKTEVCQKKAINCEVELPRLPQRPRVLYSEISKTVDVLEDAKNINKLKSLLSRQLGCEYQPGSLANSHMIGQTKMLRLHRINYMKTQE